MDSENWKYSSEAKGWNGLIDSHCHLDQYSNPLELALECEKNGITVIGMTNLPSHFESGYRHLSSFKRVRLAVGMHPLLAEHHNREFPAFISCLEKTSYIGEVGLDFSIHGIATKDEQVLTFKRILTEVSGKKKLLSIHSRKAEREVLNFLTEYKITNAIFHWYTGPLNLIPAIVDAGYYFSINTAMVSSKSGQAVISRIPSHAMLTESDGPFIKIDNIQAKPNDVAWVNKYLSSLQKMTEDEVQETIKNNFRYLISSLY